MKKPGIENDNDNVKYYSIQEAIKILPYVKSYARDIKHIDQKLKLMHKRYLKLQNLTSASKTRRKQINNIVERIVHIIALCVERFNRWSKELKQINITVCSNQLGQLDIPIYDDSTDCILTICINEDTTSKNLTWHFPNQTYQEANPYWHSKKVKETIGDK